MLTCHRFGRLAVLFLAFAGLAGMTVGCKFSPVDRKPPQPAPIATIAFLTPGASEPFLYNTSVKYAQLGATHGKGWEVFLVLNPVGAEKFYQALSSNAGGTYNVVLKGRTIGTETFDGQWPRGFARVRGNMTLAEANELLNILGEAGIAVER